MKTETKLTDPFEMHQLWVELGNLKVPGYHWAYWNHIVRTLGLKIAIEMIREGYRYGK